MTPEDLSLALAATAALITVYNVVVVMWWQSPPRRAARYARVRARQLGRPL